MNLKNNKGSVTIFVLVGLLFMSSFLIISFASNVNRSKIAKEQFDIISKIYSSKTDDESYTDEYTHLREKNKQIMTASVENNNSLELRKTFAEPISNLRIYGNSVQNGIPSPENPVEIKSVGPKVLNLIDLSKAIAQTGVCEVMPDGVKIIKSYANLTFARLSDFCKPNTTYYIHAEKITDKILSGGAGGSIRNVSYLGELLPADKTDATFTTGNTVDGELYCYGLDDSEVYFKNLYIGETPYMEGEPYNKYKISITTISGVEKTSNLLDVSKAGARVGVCEIMPDGVKIINSYANLTFARLSDFCKPNTTYYIHAEKITDKTLAGNLVNGSIRNVGYLGVLLKPTETDATFTTGDTVEGALYCYGYNDSEVYFKNFYIGEKPYTKYEPAYSIPKTMTFNIYLDQPLRKVGDVADYIDFKTGQVVRNVGIDENGNLYALPETIYETIDLPEISTYEDYTKIELNTGIAPSKIEVDYTGYTLD